ncbi:MAG: hypothetical protein SVX38_02955 [Chloroflexota bacterium]|nr:hypothetical protein [Chloroflexota bacterium]
MIIETLEEWYFSLGWLIAILAAFFLMKTLLLEFIGRVLLSIPIISSIAIWVLSLLMFPGTVVHEVSHYVAATFLFVKVSNISFLPRKRGNTISLGSVQFAKSPGPLRHALIGIAPLIGGSLVIVTIVALGFNFPVPAYFLGVPHLFTELSSLTAHIDLYVERDLFVLWLLFSVGNSIFPSQSDRGAWVLVGGLTAVLGGALWYFAGIGPSDLLIRLPLSLLEAVNMAIFALTLVLVIDLVLLMPLFIVAWGLGALAGSRSET